MTALSTLDETVVWHQAPPEQMQQHPQAQQDELMQALSLMVALPNMGLGSKGAIAEDGQTLTVTSAEGKVLKTIKLYEKVQREGVAEAQEVQENGTLVMMLNKESQETWTQLVEAPIDPKDECFVSEAVLDQLLADQVPPLPTPEVEAAMSKDEVHPITAMQLENLKDEQRQIDAKLIEYQKQIDSDSAKLLSEEKDELRKKLELLKRLNDINTRLRSAMQGPATLETHLKIQQIEILKARANSGAEGETEEEEYKDDAEKALSAKELNEAAMKSLQSKTKEGFFEGMRLLRVSALQKNDNTAAVILFRMYSEMEEHGKSAYFLVRRAGQDDCDYMTNALVGSLHDDGVRLFPPWTGMAVHYYQRAARSGRVCHMDLSNLWRKGYSKGSEEIAKKTGQKVRPDEERQMAWLRHAIARGSGVAMFIKSQLHMTGENKSFPLSKVKAVEAWGRALAAAPQLLQHQAEMEKMLAVMPEGETPAPAAASSAAAPTVENNASASDASAAGTMPPGQGFATEENSVSTTDSSFLGSTAGKLVIAGVVVAGAVVAMKLLRK